jgi:hypothetical protein
MLSGSFRNLVGRQRHGKQRIKAKHATRFLCPEKHESGLYSPAEIRNRQRLEAMIQGLDTAGKV